NEDVIAEPSASPKDCPEAITFAARIGEEEDLYTRHCRKAIDQVNDRLIGRDISDKRIQRLVLLVKHRDSIATRSEELPDIGRRCDGGRQANDLARRCGKG